tara:strand:+ start:399 stop:599 length:201 start_codon:yes stop_codon:yes gene_type:complete
LPAADSNRSRRYLAGSFLLSASAAMAQPESLLDNYTPVTLEELANPPASDWLMWRGGNILYVFRLP